MFFEGFNVVFRFIAEILFRTIMKLPKKICFGTKPRILVPPSTCLLASHIIHPARPGNSRGKRGAHPA